MARIRTIKPEFPQSESVGRLSRDARLLYIQLWTICDDSGRARAASRMLASLLYPYDDDAKRLIDRWLAELEHEKCIVRYEVDGSSYLEVCNWLSHQKIDRPSPSRLPAPSEDSRMIASPREDSPPDLGPRTMDLGREVDHGPSGSEPDITPREKQKSKREEAAEVLAFLNAKASKNFQATEANLDFILARFKEGYTSSQCRKVIARKCREWLNDDQMVRYLRPATLFNREKFNQYIGECVVVEEQPPAGFLEGLTDAPAH